MATGRNADTGLALSYHQSTKHSVASLRADPHALDWANRPLPLKIYRGLDGVALPADPTLLDDLPPALDAIGVPPDTPGPRPSAPVDLRVLTRLLYLGAGITKRKRQPGGDIYFRAYPNTGALYHLDLYLVTGDLPDLPAGVYHFAPESFALDRLRSGDHRIRLLEATGGHPGIATAPLTLISASTYWRNAWKYRARTYRHCFWDAGTMHANLLAVGDATGGRPEVVVGFADADVETLLALDPEREGALTLVPLGADGASAGHGVPTLPPAPDLQPLSPDTEPLSPTEVDYPAIRQMHAASSLPDGPAAAAWRHARPGTMTSSAPAQPRLRPLRRDQWPRRSLARVIRRRGSTRAFDRHGTIELPALATLLERATRGIRSDFVEPGGSLLELYLLVNAVDDLGPGAYRYHRTSTALEPLWAGDCRALCGRLALGQGLAADAAVNVYALCHLETVLARLGNRGYRAAQLEGGLTGGRLYLGAYALGLGATGLTFFDDDVIEAFSPQAAGRSVMFLTAIGRADRQALGLGD